MLLKKIIDSIAPNAIYTSIEENNREVTLSSRASKVSINTDTFSESLKIINNRDNFNLKISVIGTDQSLSLSGNSASEINNFLEKIELYSLDDEETESIVTLKITKETLERKCSIYSLDHIADYWSNGTILDQLNKINSLARQAYHLECHDISSTFRTGLFIFSPLTNDLKKLTNPEPPHKHDTIKARDKICIFYQSDDFSFIPEDFHFDTFFCNKKIQQLFKNLRLALCLIYLCDNSRLNNKGKLELSLNGYKRISYTLDDSHQDLAHSNEYYEIYQWAYTQGNTSDKVSLCRNVLSIHIEEDNLLRLRPGCIAATTSNYAIYLKENLKQYVEIKNKINEQIQKSSEKASDLVKGIGTYLKGSIFSLYSFVFSVFLIRTLAKPTNTVANVPASPMISTATYYIFLLFATISLLILGYAVAEMNAEIRRFKKNHTALKKRYNDLITETDLSQILQNDNQYKLDLTYLRSARRRAVTLWLLSIIVISTVISTIYLTKI